MRQRLFESTAFLLIAAAPVAAWGQSAGTAAPPGAEPSPAGSATPVSTAAESGGLAEITVTAQRRTENLQNVPIAATALSGSQLEEKAVTRISDLQFAAPSLSVVDAGLTQSVNIRGIGIASGSPAVANGVAVYINGVFQPPLLTTSSFYDIGSIEVLRGPQGTLVGSNSTGGAIFINSAAPELDRVGGFLQGALGNYSSAAAQGAINVPLTDNLAIRAAGNYERHDSYFNDIGTYHNHPNRLDEKAGRLGVLWTPGNLHALGHVEWIDKQTGGYAYRPLPGTPYGAGAIGDIRTLDHDAPTSNYERGFLADLELRYQLADGITIRSMTGYTSKRVTNLYDTDGTALNTAATPAQTEDQFVREREVSQEINLLSPTTGRFNWILGGYFQHNIINVRILNHTGAPVDPTHIVINDYKTTVGAFAQAGYKITDRVEFQLGARYSHYAVTQDGGVAIGYGTIFGPTGLTVANLGSNHKDGRLTGKANVNFQVDDDNLVYAFVARGYKPGGANSSVSQFRPETVWDYETGWKSTMLDKHLRTQLGAFYMNYNDFQFDFVDTSTGQSGVVNVASAKIYGVEGQVQAKYAGFDVDAGFAYVHSKLGSLTAVNSRLIPPGTTLGPQCGAIPTAGCTNYGPYFQQAGGGPNLFSPKWSYNVGIDYEIAIKDGVSLTPRLNYAFVGSQYAGYFYTQQFDTLRSRGLLSALVTLRVKKWTLEGYGTNLTNKTYVSGITGNNQFYGPPREYGVRVAVRF
ncbi:TonB-dependent receptor [Polymorphobacter sp. PAMC 29334]|uniref:TonB-dependent receptor n=1 Tax=Polymorphobacter sp. PAMC 29334 TaxID=2862331 RepID=UPI001C78BE88|nr:TonB-dependent receptor [Polymorphobacter sp. PAMC 29334]QYE35753.1 TonB-dependent receptor [Polymorphobacter sp. PAMC 29334]